MRTTLDIDDSVLAAAKEIAAATNSSAGAVISELARKGLSRGTDTVARTKSGFPVFHVPADATPLTSATVKSILSDDGLPSGR
jgi:hypothetical protein